jgi:hypothetical protein
MPSLYLTAPNTNLGQVLKTGLSSKSLVLLAQAAPCWETQRFLVLATQAAWTASQGPRARPTLLSQRGQDGASASLNSYQTIWGPPKLLG